MKNLAMGALVSTLLVALCQPASAHIVLQEKSATAGKAYRAVLVVGHGCGDAPTTGIRVQIPEGFYNVRPMPKAGWTIELTTGAYETPFESHGTRYTEGVKEISWSGGELPNDFFDEFVFRGTFGADVPADAPFHFPVIQTCGAEESPWIDTSGDEAAEFPAPAVTISPVEAGGHHH